jgi:hypothetical protein
MTKLLHKHCLFINPGTEPKADDISCDDTPRTRPRRYLNTCTGMSGVLPGFEPGIPGRRQDFGIPHQSMPRRFSEEPTPIEDRSAIIWKNLHGHLAHSFALSMGHFVTIIFDSCFILKEKAIDSDVCQLLSCYQFPEIQRLEHRLRQITKTTEKRSHTLFV